MDIWNDDRIDRRDKEYILEQIHKLARSYTPEWRFDTKNPDAGSVIGMIFANQMMDNIRKLNLVLDKYHTEFANMYGASLQAAKPSNSVVVLGREDSFQAGVSLQKGTQVLGENNTGEEVIFEFLHDIYVSSAKLYSVLLISGAKNRIIPVYERERAGMAADIPLFSYEREGIGGQALLLYHPYLFGSQDKAVRLKFHGTIAGIESTKAIAELMADREQFEFSYYTAEGKTAFDYCICQDDAVLLSRKGEEVKQNMDGEAMSVIRIGMLGTLQDNIVLQRIEIMAEDRAYAPDFIYNGTTELDAKKFLPFGEQISLYQECYIGQKDLLCQKGMQITLSFDLSFETYRLRNSGRQKPDLRVIKRKPRIDYTKIYYECYVQEIAFEYYNGKGWKKLNCDSDIRHLFGSGANAGRHSISFVIPYDWEATVQGGSEQELIRMQAVRADNCFMQEVEYYYPVISGLSMQIQYLAEGLSPKRVIKEREAEREDVTSRFIMQEDVVVFSRPAYTGDYAFLGFDQRFGPGPIGFFFELAEDWYDKKASLDFYYSSGNGFKPLKVIDQTDGLQHSGTMLFMPPADMAMQKVEGITRFWLRIEDTRRYFALHPAAAPVIKRFYINAVSVQNVVTLDEQDYFMEQAAANMRFPLYAANILEAEVWVNEIRQLSELEMEEMLEKTPQRIRIDYNFLGEREDFYVLWKEVENFDEVPEDGRCYLIDRGTNELLFGDGVHVRIPQDTESVSFKVRPKYCNGSGGNIAAGTIHAFRGNIRSINEITNPITAFGGSDMEEPKDALKRSSNILGSRRRLVSETDYIREAMLFSDTIAQAACVCGTDRSGQDNSGGISLVLLMRDYRGGSYAFRSMKKNLKEYLFSHCEMTLREEDIEIVEPVFVQISVQIWLTVPDITGSIEIKQYWQKRIEEYLEPVTAQNETNWSIGKLPDEKQIRVRLSAMEHEVRLEKMLIIASYEDAKGLHEAALDQLKETPFMICCNGKHRIHISEK